MKRYVKASTHSASKYVSYEVVIRYSDGSFDCNNFANINDAEDFVDDSIEWGNSKNSVGFGGPITYYRIVKTETTDDGMVVSESLIEQDELV